MIKKATGDSERTKKSILTFTFHPLNDASVSLQAAFSEIVQVVDHVVIGLKHCKNKIKTGAQLATLIHRNRNAAMKFLVPSLISDERL